MMVKAEQDDLKKVLIETITSVCREKLKSSEFSVEGLIAVTLEKDQVVLVNINESLKCQSSAVSNNIILSSALSPTLTNGGSSLTPPGTSPKLQVNGNSSLLCSIVSKAPLVVAPFQIPTPHKGGGGGGLNNGTTPRATLLQTTQGQTLTLDATKHLKIGEVAKHSQKITLDTAKNINLGEVVGNGIKHHRGVSSSQPAAAAQEPPPKRRLLEEHLTSHLPLVSSSHNTTAGSSSINSSTFNTVSLLDNVVIKKEVLSDDEDFPSSNRRGSCSSQALSLDLDGGDSTGSAHNGGVSSAELRKMVRSDKMWNQHPVAQLSVAHLATNNTQGSTCITLGSSTSSGGGAISSSSISSTALYANSLIGQQDMFEYQGVCIKEEDDEDTSSYLSTNSTLDDGDPETDEEEFFKLARSILLYKGTFITVHSFCKVSRRTGKNTLSKISSERACWVMQKMNVPAWDEKYIGEYKELRKGTKVFFKCPPDMVNPKALAYYSVPLQTYSEGYYEEARSASFPTKTELLKRILDASPY